MPKPRKPHILHTFLCCALLCFVLLCFALPCFGLLHSALLCFFLLGESRQVGRRATARGDFALLWFTSSCSARQVSASGTATSGSGQKKTKCKHKKKHKHITENNQNIWPKSSHGGQNRSIKFSAKCPTKRTTKCPTKCPTKFLRLRDQNVRPNF